MPNTKTVVPYSGTPEQEAQLKAVIAQYKDVPGGTMPVMQKAQDIFGYLPEEVQIMIAEGMGIPLEEVYGISTFYSLYNLNPKGQYKITVCLGTACYVKGSQKVLDKLSEVLDVPVGKTTADRRFTLNATRCLGACGLAPVMMINDEVYGRLVPDDIPGIIEKYRA